MFSSVEMITVPDPSKLAIFAEVRFWPGPVRQRQRAPKLLPVLSNDFGSTVSLPEFPLGFLGWLIGEVDCCDQR